MKFIARRGKPNTIISDNGTNFVGAEREFAEYVAAWNKEGVEEILVQRGIRWKINPDGSSSVGKQISHRGRSFNNDVYC